MNSIYGKNKMFPLSRLSQLDESLTARFVVPIIMENCFTVFINMAISGVISTISASALAAIGMANSIMSVVSALFSVVIVGSSVLISRQVGAEEYADAAESIEQSSFIGIVVASAITLLSVVFASPLLRLLMPTAEAGLFGEAIRYFRTVMLTLPFFVLHGVFSGICRGLGNSRITLITTVTMSLSQLLFAWLCISVLPLNEIGAGAAMGVGRIVGAGILLFTLLRERRRFTIKIRNMFLPKLSVCRRIFRIGLPITFESLFVQLGYMLANSMSIALGTFESAVFQIVNTVYGFAGLPQGVFTTIALSASGHLLGRKDYKGVKTAGYSLWGLGVLISGSMSLIAILFGRQICGFYSSDPETIEACLKILWVILPLNLVANSVNIIDQPLRTGGDSTFVMIIALLTVWVFRLPITWLLCFKLNMGALGVFLGNTIALSFRTISGLIRFSTEKWMYKKV